MDPGIGKNQAEETYAGRLRLGVVGCGRVFERYHLPALKRSPDWDLVAVCEFLKERREWIQKSYQGVSAFESFPELLENSTLDALLITTPPVTHSHLAIRALERGLHVLVEKPMALNILQGQMMLEAALQSRKHLWVGFNRRFRRSSVDLKGRLEHVPVDSIQEIRYLNESPPRQTVTPYLGDDSKGGGVLDDVASHQVDLLAWLLSQPVEEVRVCHSSKNKDSAASARYELRFKNGLIAYCEAVHSRTYFESLQIKLQDRTVLAYPAGVIEGRFAQTKWIRFYCKLKNNAHLAFQKLRRKPNVSADSFERQLRSFAAAIRNEIGHQIGADARDGLRVVRAIQTCRESLRSGGKWQSLNQQERTI